MKFSRDFVSSKTTWAGIAAVAAAIASFYAGNESFAQAEQQIVTALLAVFVRDAVGKVGQPPA